MHDVAHPIHLCRETLSLPHYYNIILWLLFYYLSTISLFHYNRNLKSKIQFDLGSMSNLRDFCFEMR